MNHEIAPEFLFVQVASMKSRCQKNPAKAQREANEKPTAIYLC